MLNLSKIYKIKSIIRTKIDETTKLLKYKQNCVLFPSNKQIEYPETNGLQF